MASSSFLTVNWPQLSCYGGASLFAYYSLKQGVKLVKNTFNIFMGSASLDERVKNVMNTNLPLHHKSKNFLVGSENLKDRLDYLGQALLNTSFGILSGIAAYILFDMGLQMGAPLQNYTPTAQEKAKRLKEELQLGKVASTLGQLTEIKTVVSHLHSIRLNQVGKLSDYFPQILKQQFDELFDKILACYYKRWTTELPKELQELLVFDKESLSKPKVTELNNNDLFQNTISKQETSLSERAPSATAATKALENINSSLTLEHFTNFLVHLGNLIKNDQEYRAQDLANQEAKLSASLGPFIFRLHHVCDYLKDSFENPSAHSHSWATSLLSERCKPYFSAKEPNFSEEIMGNLIAFTAERFMNANNQPVANKIADMAVKDSDEEIQKIVTQIIELLNTEHPDSTLALISLSISNPEVCAFKPNLPRCPKKP